VLCNPVHIADHTDDPDPIIDNGHGKPLVQAPIHVKGKKGTIVVLSAKYNKLAAECTSQKVRILDFKPPNELTVALDQGELMDDIVHQLGYRVVSMTEFSREKRTVFILERK